MEWLLVEDVDGGEPLFPPSFCPLASAKEEALCNFEFFHDALIEAIHLVPDPFEVN